MSNAEQDNKARVESILDRYRGTGTRIRLYLGDPSTGRDWGEENDVTGYIGRSAGWGPTPMKVPLLLHKQHSSGGGAILVSNVLRILADGREVYRHPKYKEPVYELREGNIQSPIGPLPFEVWSEGQNQANFKTAAQRQRWLDFMRGVRSTK
jgi:hypothetical protein